MNQRVICMNVKMICSNFSTILRKFIGSIKLYLRVLSLMFSNKNVLKSIWFNNLEMLIELRLNKKLQLLLYSFGFYGLCTIFLISIGTSALVFESGDSWNSVAQNFIVFLREFCRSESNHIGWTITKRKQYQSTCV